MIPSWTDLAADRYEEYTQLVFVRDRPRRVANLVPNGDDCPELLSDIPNENGVHALAWLGLAARELP